jgi:hypothetical protein
MEANILPFDLTIFSGSLMIRQAVDEVLECNDGTKHYALVLNEQQAVELIETRSCSLKETGRFEFGGGIINKLINVFCSSPFIMQDNYAEIIHELIEIFYYFKNETLDRMSDDDLIKFMKKSFDGQCQSSLELVKGRELERLSRRIRYGNDFEYLKIYGEEKKADND